MTPRQAAEYARRAYVEPPTVGEVDSSSRALIEVLPDGTVVVAFRGSDNAATWAHDLDVETVRVQGLGEVHRGFWRALKPLMSALFVAIGGKPVIFVGHSLGAAMALLAAADYSDYGHPPKEVWAFEPPRVSCDDSVADLLVNVPTYLYRNGLDVVTDVPCLLHSWRHPATLIQIGRSALPVPNIEDHNILRVIQALPE